MWTKTWFSHIHGPHKPSLWWSLPFLVKSSGCSQQNGRAASFPTLPSTPAPYTPSLSAEEGAALTARAGQG